ncbi:hypothetical protein QFC22_001716 [Naganishia vaughanmartiniae]|uniref:Uncharacterized protein n=1 Tax=Naganishia vaughanmartiniae TaxID=1424756 RepID=A0ACC2XFY3_9TREE|nr:hypothetical protein QFC22_001716 [Naganishia vaughanmartiniae]
MGWLSSKLSGEGHHHNVTGDKDDTADQADFKSAIATDDGSSHADLLSTVDLPLLAGTGPQIRYEIAFDAKLSNNLVLKRLDASSNTWNTVYWIEDFEWKKEPDLVFHDGDRQGPVIGSTIMRKRIHDMTLRLGGGGTLQDHQEDGALLGRISQDKKYHDKGYTLSIPTTSGGSRMYHFERTQSTKDGVKGFMGKLAFYNWLITNVRKETVGLYLENVKGAISLTRGALTIKPDTLDEESDMTYVLLGLVTIMERTQRDLLVAIAVT